MIVSKKVRNIFYGKLAFLGIILLVAILAKNQSLMLAAAFVLIMKLIPTSRSFFLGFKAKESILV